MTIRKHVHVLEVARIKILPSKCQRGRTSGCVASEKKMCRRPGEHVAVRAAAIVLGNNSKDFRGQCAQELLYASEKEC